MIDGDQFAKGRPGAIVMILEYSAADPANIQKAESTFEEPADRCLVRGVEHRTAGSASAGNFIP